MNGSQFVGGVWADPVPVRRRSWIAPAIEELPALTALTLSSPEPIGGDHNGFSWLNGSNPINPLG